MLKSISNCNRKSQVDHIYGADYQSVSTNHWQKMDFIATNTVFKTNKENTNKKTEHAPYFSEGFLFLLEDPPKAL